jgi:hypothetical protein
LVTSTVGNILFLSKTFGDAMELGIANKGHSEFDGALSALAAFTRALVAIAVATGDNFCLSGPESFRTQNGSVTARVLIAGLTCSEKKIALKPALALWQPSAAEGPAVSR